MSAASPGASSASPDRLTAFASTLSGADVELRGVAARLTAALRHFRATRPEYIDVAPLTSDADLELALMRHAMHQADVDEWVGRLGRAFAEAGANQAQLAALPWLGGVVGAVLAAEAVPADVSLAGETELEHAMERDYNPWARIDPGTHDEWLRESAIAFDPTRCDNAHYAGGGFLTGPDGRRYPLIIPDLPANGTLVNADMYPSQTDPLVSDLGGQDQGWFTVYETQGLTDFRNDVSALDKVASLLAPTDSDLPFKPASPDVLAHLAVDGNGVPSLPKVDRANLDAPFGNASTYAYDQASALAHLDGRQAVVLPDGSIALIDPKAPEAMSREIRRFVERTQGLEPNPAIDKGETLNSIAGWGPSFAANVERMQHLDDPIATRYQAVFQQNVDGRSRALLRVYRVTRVENMTLPYVINGSYAYVDGGGHLAFQPIHFQRGSQAVMGPGDPGWWVQNGDAGQAGSLP